MARAMKDSGIEWIGEIPEDWKVERLKYSINEVNEKNFPIKTTRILSLTNRLGVVPYEEKGNQGNKAKEDFTEYKLAYENTIIANSMNILIGSVGLSKYDGCVSPVYYVYKATDKTDIRFINYIFNTIPFQKELRKFANGIMEIRLRISSEDILKRDIVIPIKQKQSEIANFLDLKCAKIDAVIKKTEETIQQYKIFKQSIIINTITKGLDEHVSYKNSNIDWIGKIPNHYEVVRLKYITQISRGLFNHRPRNDERYYDGQYPFIQTGDVASANKYITSYSQTLNELGKSVSKQFPKGTMTMTIAANIGDVAILGFDAFFPDSVVGCVSLPEYENNYVYYLYCSLKDIFIQSAVVSTQLNLNIDRIKNIKVCVTHDKDEQIKISKYLDKKCLEIDNLMKKKKQIIEQLEIYKQSLIYEYVTGKKEVK